MSAVRSLKRVSKGFAGLTARPHSAQYTRALGLMYSISSVSV